MQAAQAPEMRRERLRSRCCVKHECYMKLPLRNRHAIHRVQMLRKSSLVLRVQAIALQRTQMLRRKLSRPKPKYIIASVYHVCLLQTPPAVPQLTDFERYAASIEGEE